MALELGLFTRASVTDLATGGASVLMRTLRAVIHVPPGVKSTQSSSSSSPPLKPKLKASKRETAAVKRGNVSSASRRATRERVADRSVTQTPGSKSHDAMVADATRTTLAGTSLCCTIASRVDAPLSGPWKKGEACSIPLALCQKVRESVLKKKARAREPPDTFASRASGCARAAERSTYATQASVHAEREVEQARARRGLASHVG